MLNRRFLQKVSTFIAAKKLLFKEKRYLVALSGGADSVALLLVLRDLGYDIEAAHCNFHLRGEESGRDEAFCRDLCKRHGIVLHVAGFDTVSYAKMHKESIEMAARNLRYAYFENLISDLGLSAVCVAHHKNDSVETVLLNLIRGTGIHGLTGISPLNGNVVRPFLCVSRHDIERTLAEAGQDFVTDSTNLVDDVVRNKIRLGLLPLMRQINPSVSESILATAENVGEAAKVFDSVVLADAGRITEKGDSHSMRIDIKGLLECVSPESVLFHVLKDYSYNAAQARQVLGLLPSGVGKVFLSPTHQLLIDRDYIVVEPLGRGESKNMKIPCEGTYRYGDGVKLRVELLPWSLISKVEADKDVLYADASKVGFPLVVRVVADGDRFVPFGMKGSKLVSDFLTDGKMNLFDKQRQLVVTDSEGHIVWLVSQRPDNRVRVSPNTRSVLRIKVLN